MSENFMQTRFDERQEEKKQRDKAEEDVRNDLRLRAEQITSFFAKMGGALAAEMISADTFEIVDRKGATCGRVTSNRAGTYEVTYTDKQGHKLTDVYSLPEVADVIFDHLRPT